MTFRKGNLASLVWGLGIATVFATSALAQYPGGAAGPTAGTTGAMPGSGGTGGAYNLSANYHINFNRPEAWALKRFASASLLSGALPPESPEGHRVGSITIGLEVDWIPELSSGQQRVGYNGMAPEDLNKTPVFARPVVRIGLPDKFSAIVAVPPPFEVFGVTPHLIAFGLERPLVERPAWTISWRGYGQVGWVKGAFTCPNSVLAFQPGSPQNPTECIGQSSDKASLRYAGSEFIFAYRPPRAPRVIPHFGIAGNFIDGVFHVNAPVEDGTDRTRLWTRGGTFSTSGGVTFLVTKQAAFTVNAFYTPLFVQRMPGGPTQNDGLFNMRAMLSYRFR